MKRVNSQGSLGGTVEAARGIVGWMVLGLTFAVATAQAQPSLDWSEAVVGTFPHSAASPDNVRGLVNRASVVDPTGDTFGTGVPQIDISEFSATVDGVDLIVGIEFATSISPPVLGAPDSVVGLIEIDSDQNPATGTGAAYNTFCPSPVAIGTEAFISVGDCDEAMGGCPVIDSATTAVLGVAPVTFSASSLEISIPLSVLGDDGLVDLVTILGTAPEPTDCAPDGAVLTSDVLVVPGSPTEIPTLGTWGVALLVAALLGIGLVGLSRRDPVAS